MKTAVHLKKGVSLNIHLIQNKCTDCGLVSKNVKIHQNHMKKKHDWLLFIPSQTPGGGNNTADSANPDLSG